MVNKIHQEYEDRLMANKIHQEYEDRLMANKIINVQFSTFSSLYLFVEENVVVKIKIEFYCYILL